jgi:glutathione synthase
LSSVRGCYIHYDFADSLDFWCCETGNNTYGADVSEKLIQLRKTDGGAGLAAYILMQRIFPAVHPAYLVHDGNWSCKETISELGIFSTYLR